MRSKPKRVHHKADEMESGHTTHNGIGSDDKKKPSENIAQVYAKASAESCLDPVGHINAMLAEFNYLGLIASPCTKRAFQVQGCSESWKQREQMEKAVEEGHHAMGINGIHCLRVFDVKHHWASGSHTNWLAARLLGFRTEHRKGRNFTYEFIDTELKVYYMTYHWSVTLKEEPPLPLHNPNVVEVLTPEEQAYVQRHKNQMCGVLYRWWETCATTLENAEMSKLDFPLVGLLAEVGGLVTEQLRGPR
ncbi:hypothetical protein EDD18DRAFT_1359546 [Armillaria luteobubalina]|uniref:Uncharacterized protein n=1 Tax=Armillaria luteobubalina TaxID=153913 RepID=A0AA39PPS2_9AGAR|nr:hypothetical protein EDD18DRAFT_1359546 [Armillaria luteobubalina]